MNVLLPIYRMATILLGPFVQIHLQWRLAAGKEDPTRILERLGQPSYPRPKGSLIWIHAASVGESISMLPLIEAILKQKSVPNMLVTSGTLTSAELLAERLPRQAIHQFIPLDRAQYVNTFLNHWSPNLVLWVESEFWPNLTTLVAARDIPMVLVNGRVSPGSYSKWCHWRGFSQQILNSFSLCLAQSKIDADRLSSLGATNVINAGNLKFAVPPLPVDNAELTKMRDATRTRPIWLAASTHEGEEGVAFEAHRKLSELHPDILTVIVPRHPGRGREIATEIERQGAQVQRRGDGDNLTANTEIYIADTIGEMGLFYRLASVTFVGKSLVNLGGQNPIEPARLRSAILFGPHMWNFPDVSDQLLRSRGARQVTGPDSLARAVSDLLSNPEKRYNQVTKATQVACGHNNILANVLEQLNPLISIMEEETTL